MDLDNKNVLITGGAGFIGSNLVEQLVKLGANVTIIDSMIAPYGGNEFNLVKIRKKIQFEKADVRSRDQMRELVKNKDFIFHLAGQTGRVISMNNPFLDLDINCNGMLSLLEAIKSENRRVKLIYASSRGVIGVPRYLPVDENHPTNPEDIYGANKLTAEKYCLIYVKTIGLPASIIRLNNVYGPKCQVRSNHYGTINLFIAYALQGKTLPVYGDGTQTRDYVYIDDVVSAFIKIATNKAVDGELFFVSSGKEYSLLEIVNIIQKEIPTTKYTLVPYPPDLKKIDFQRFFSTSEKIYKAVGWIPKTSLEQGIKKTINYYLRNLEKYI